MAYPLTGEWLRRLRDIPCQSGTARIAAPCTTPEEQLRRFFGWDTFRLAPRNNEGGSLQRDIVEAGLRNDSLLAILPTGGGKSLCFQLPALVRNYRRGVLTLVISPCRRLMKDQVDGLVRRTGTGFAAALYGMLTPLERGDVLRRVASGDIAILYVSPNSFAIDRSTKRSHSERLAVGCSTRRIVFQNGATISVRIISTPAASSASLPTKQGVIFRPSPASPRRPNATSKRRSSSFSGRKPDRELALFEGGVERENLVFEVQAVPAPAKRERVARFAFRAARGRRQAEARSCSGRPARGPMRWPNTLRPKAGGPSSSTPV